MTRWYGDTEDHSAQNLVGLVKQLGRDGINVSGYLKTNSESCYGNNVFTASLSDLLISYKYSRIRSNELAGPKQITLRVGGTLRYKHEICYVVIVCLEEDDPVTKYPSIYKERILKNNGLVSDDGNIKDHSKIPEFKAQHIVKVGGRHNSFSWENVAFAFYFPSWDSEFRCATAKMTKGIIRHPRCTSTRRGPDGKMLCPNEYYT